MRFPRWPFSLVLAFSICQCLPGQEVVSARSGTVNFTEGSVYLDDQAVSRKSGTFPQVKEGSVLRTEQGRAEVLLTPGAFVRLDENTSMRLQGTGLSDTRIEFLSGSMIFDLAAARANNAISVTYKASRIRFPESGVYRLDSDTGVLQTYSGKAEVTYDAKKTELDAGHLFFCWLGLTTDKLGEGTEDEFYDWASDRNQMISEENQLAQQTAADPGDLDVNAAALAGGGSIPYLGAPGPSIPYLRVPSFPTPYGGYSYGRYSMGSTFGSPFPTIASRPFLPFGAYPLVVLQAPYRAVHSHMWPHSGTNPAWHPVTGVGSPSPVHVPVVPSGVMRGVSGGYHPGVPMRSGPGLSGPGLSGPAVIGPAPTGRAVRSSSPVMARPMARR